MPAPLEVIGYALDRLVEFALQSPRRSADLCGHGSTPINVTWPGMLLEEAPYATQKSLNTFDARVLPVEIAVGRCGEEAVEAGSVGAVGGDHFIGAHNIAEALRHFCAVLDHHALREQALDGFVVGDEAKIAHELGPEARVDEVQDCVLNAADVLVNGKPVLRNLRVERSTVVVRVS